jgi:AsmA protein
MNKSLRLGLKIFAALILLLFVVAISLPFLIDPNEYKGEIIARVKQETGRELAIPGNINLSVFPWLGVKLGEVTLGNSPGFGDQPMARIKAVDVRVKLLPLLQKDVQIAHVTLDGLTLNLQRNAKGQANWDDLVGKDVPTKPKEKEAQPGGAMFAALAVDGLSLTNSQLDWLDAQAGQHYTLDDIELSLGAVVFDKAFPLKANLTFTSRQPEANGELALTTDIILAANLQQVSLKHLKLNTHLNTAALTKPLPPVTVELTSLDLDLKNETLNSEKLRLAAYNLDLEAEVAVQKLLSAPSYQGALHIAPFSLRESLSQLGFPLPTTADTEALQRAELVTDFQGTTNRLKLDNLRLKLDDSSLTGNAELPRLGEPVVSYNLALDQVDADRYLPPPTETQPAKAQAAPIGSSAAVAATQLPLELLRALVVQGRLKIDQLKVSNLQLHNIFLPTSAKQGIIRFSPIRAELYKGRYEGNISLNVQQNTPQLGINETLQNVQIGPLLKDFWGDDKIRGTANLKATLTARGVDPIAFRKTLNGTAQFEFRDGTIKGFNLAQMERDLNARLKGQPVSREKVPLETDFASITGSLTATNGLVRNDDLQATMPYARAIGAGKAFLVNEELDYTLQVKFTSKAIGQGGQTYAQMDKVPLPIHIRGSFSQPRFEPDYEAVIKALAKQEIEKEKQQLEEKAKKKIEKEIGEELKKLFR